MSYILDNQWPNLIDNPLRYKEADEGFRGVSWTSSRINLAPPTPHDDAIALQRQIAARSAFPESRGMLALDRVLDRLTDGPRRVERAIGSALGAAGLLVLFGWALGRR